MTKPKLCIECRHCRKEVIIFAEFYTCRRVKSVSPVTGKGITVDTYCADERDSNARGDCGHEGRFWEAKAHIGGGENEHCQ